MGVSFDLAICTYNRSAVLERALASLAQCKRPQGAWRVLVIDNNSRDETLRITSSFAERLPIQYLFEPVQGLSHARNRALRECRSDVLLFTDDDLIFDGDWLVTYEKAFSEQMNAGWFGGRVRPLWESGRPGWLKDDTLALIEGLLVHYDLGSNGRPYCGLDTSPFGASFALRRSVFERFGDFRVDLGVVGTTPGRGEESEYFERVRESEVPGWYVGECSAWHWQDPRRFRLLHLYRYGYQTGLAELRRGHVSGQGAGSLAREGVFLLKALRQWLIGRGDRARQCVINMGIQRGIRCGSRS